MKTSMQGKDVLQQREGCKLTAYQDSVGVWTIGVGHTAAAGPPTPVKGMTITQQEANDIFTRDLVAYEKPVNSCLVPLAQEEYDALVSICYNIGQNGFTGSTFWKRLNVGDYQGCADAILMWNKPSDIITRRNGEQVQFCIGSYNARCNKPAPAYVPKADVARRTLRKGMVGEDVMEAQTMLGGLVVDGNFGQQTEDAVKAFQQAYGLTVDGIIGPNTWDMLDDASAGEGTPQPEPTPEPPIDETPTVEIIINGNVKVYVNGRLVTE